MTGFLEGYGAGEEQRERKIKRALAALLGLAVLATGLYFGFRNYREERQLRQFLDLLARKDFRSAYGLWGCSESKPCRDYSFDKFLEDWGPNSHYTDIAAIKVVRTRTCRGGLIKGLESGGNQVLLWVERKDLTLGFAPWPICNPRIPTPAM